MYQSPLLLSENPIPPPPRKEASALSLPFLTTPEVFGSHPEKQKPFEPELESLGSLILTPEMPQRHSSSSFHIFHFLQCPEKSPETSSLRPVYVSLSSSLRLIDVEPGSSLPTASDFFHPDDCLSLKRISDVEPLDSQALQFPLHTLASRYVRAETHPGGPAVRISYRKKKVALLIALNENDRNALLSALRLRVVPWNILGAHFNAKKDGGYLSQAALTKARHLFFGLDMLIPPTGREITNAKVARLKKEILVILISASTHTAFQ